MSKLELKTPPVADGVKVKGRVTSFVTPWICKLPFASYPVAVLVTAVEVKLMVGYFVASNHFSLLAWVFFMPLPVLIVDTSTETSNFEVARLAGSKLAV